MLKTKAYAPSGASEKAPFLEGGTQRRYVSYRRDAMLICFAIAITTGLHWIVSFKSWTDIPFHLSKTVENFNFEDITPTPTLEYHSCFDSFQCARLEVPLDWNETTKGEGPKVAIAIIKRPAKVDITDPRYGGPILFNPGGPGGSGVALMLTHATEFQIIVDTKAPLDRRGKSDYLEEKYFDVMSWDPRAVGYTTPGLDCIGDPLARQAWRVEAAALGHDFGDPNIFNNLWSRSITWGANCASNNTGGNAVNGNEHVGQYISTANIVGDMVEIIERHGEWREKTAKALLAASCKKHAAAVLERTAWRKDEEQLQYWGFSYGTILGQTFASMQPHRVGRLVLDGVADAEDYARNQWEHNLFDIDSITRNFTTMCYDAGVLGCKFYDPRGADQILENFNAILEGLKTEPLGVTPTDSPYVTVITHSDVVSAIEKMWYTAYYGFDVVASFMTELAHGNGTYLATLKPTIGCDFPKDITLHDRAAPSTGFLCGDGDPPLDVSKAAFQTYLNVLRNQSTLFGDLWSLVRLPCLGYSIRPKWRFPGPFGAETTNPILFASQTYDPVTPLRVAKAASKLFPGSAVVEAHGLGHCSISMPSVCAMLTIKDYFRTGVVPVGGRWCERSAGPFGEGQVEGSENQDELLWAVKSLAERWNRN